VKDVIILCPCGDPDYPADLFTSCLTTPIPMALRWFILQNPALGLKPDMVDRIPGNVSERKTPLGELNWILTSVLDAIAWNILSKPLFQRLFRQDLMVASMFRNFLLADRILSTFRCTPQTVPPMPADAFLHPLWLEWDLTGETFLFQLKQAGVFDSLPEKMTAPLDDGYLCRYNQTTAARLLPKRSSDHPSPCRCHSLPNS
jgi:regulatory associated protein of mTOR